MCVEIAREISFSALAILTSVDRLCVVRSRKIAKVICPTPRRGPFRGVCSAEAAGSTALSRNERTEFQCTELQGRRGAVVVLYNFFAP